MATMTGKTIGGYEILQEVGRGAMGVVFKAKQKSMDRVVALKFLPKSMAQQDKLVQRFVREARAAGKLSHPNIVAVHDVGQMEGLYFISMEFVDGTTAHKRMKSQGPFREEEVLDIGLQMAAALKEAHNRGILHRDVKPDNFLIDNNKRAKLADLGLARIDEEGQQGHLTQDGSALGTPHYMSPEQASGTPANARSDLYSLGASLYVLASGQTPFEGKTAATIMVSVIKDAPTPLKQLAPDLSPGFIALVEKMMHKDPAKRFQNAQETLDALGKVKSGEYLPGKGGATGKAPTTGSAQRVRERRAPAGTTAAPEQGSPALFIGLGVGAAVLVLALVFGLKGGSKPAANPTASSTNTNTQAQNSGETPARETKAGETGSSQPDPAAAKRQAEQAKAKDDEARAAENKLSKEWAALQDEADKAVAEERFRDALGRLREFVQAHAAGVHGEAAAKKLEAVRGKFAERMKSEIEKALALADSDRAAAREQLDKLKLRMPDPLEQDAGLNRAYERLAELDRAAAESARAAELADAKTLEEALKKADRLVMGDETRFQFEAAAKAIAGAAALLKADGAKITAGLWAERYKRAGQAWSEVLNAAGTKPLEVATLGHFKKGKVTSKNDKGLVHKPDQLLEQPVPWKAITGEQALALVGKTQEEKAPDVTALDQGLFAYAVGYYRGAVKLLGRAKELDVQKPLAQEPYERALKKLDDEAKAAFAAAQAAHDKKDADAVRREAGLLLPPGDLAATEFAKSKEGELRKMLEAQPAPAAVAAVPDAPKDPKEKKDGTEELKRVGWEAVGGEWSLTGKKGEFKVKDGFIKADAKNAVVSVTAKLSAGAKLEVLVRRDEGSVKRTKDFVNGIKMFAGDRAKALEDAVARLAEGYGVILEGAKAQVFTTDRIPGMPGGGGPGGGGPGRRPGGGRFGGNNPLNEAPLRVAEWDAQGDAHNVEVSIKDNNLDIKVDAYKRTDANDMRDSGDVYIKITGEAVIFSPIIKRQ